MRKIQENVLLPVWCVNMCNVTDTVSITSSNFDRLCGVIYDLLLAVCFDNLAVLQGSQTELELPGKVWECRLESGVTSCN